MQPDPTSPLDLDAIRERVARATPGPWQAQPGSRGLQSDGTPWPSNYVQPVGDGPRFSAHTEADAVFIAAARIDIPTLLAALDYARADIATLLHNCQVGAEEEEEAKLALAEVRRERDALRADVASLGHWYCPHCEQIPPAVDADEMATCCGNQAEWSEPETLTSVKTYAERLRAARDKAWTEAERMRPVVEAAREMASVMRLVEELKDGGLSRQGRALLAAVDTYETQGSTDADRT